MPVSILHSYVENDKTISIHFKDVCIVENVKRLYSPWFVKVNDLQKGHVATIDLFNRIEYLGDSAPVEEWLPDGLHVTLFKCDPGLWNRLVIDPKLLRKEELHDRRNNSIKEAEYENELQLQAKSTHRLRVIQDNAQMELEKHETRARNVEEALTTKRNEAIEIVNLSLADETDKNSKDTQLLGTSLPYPMRGKCIRITMNMTPKVQGRPSRVISEIS